MLGLKDLTVVDAILASNTLCEKFWQHNGAWGKGRNEASEDIILFLLPNLPHFSFYGVLPNC
jgi:hypothetical protein